MSTVVRDINFFLDSSQSDQYNGIIGTSVVWSLDAPVVLKNPGNYFQVAINKFTASNSPLFFEFVVQEQIWIHGGGGTSDTIYFNPGVYNINDLIASANKQANHIHGDDLTYFKLDSDGHFVIDYTSKNDTLEMDFSSTKLLYMLGYAQNMYGAGAPLQPTIPPSTLYVSTYRPPNPLNYCLYILWSEGTSDNHALVCYPPIANGSGPLKPIGEDRRCIASIPMSNGFKSPIFYETQNIVFSTINTQTIDTIEISLATNTYAGFIPISNFAVHILIQEVIPAQQNYPVIGAGQSINPIGEPLPPEEKPLKVITVTEDEKAHQDRLVELARKLKQKRKRQQDDAPEETQQNQQDEEKV